MIQVKLTPEQQKLIEDATEPVEIVDSRGQVFARVAFGFTEGDLELAAQRSRDFKDGGEFRDIIKETRSRVEL